MDSEATLGLLYGFLPPGEEGSEAGFFFSSAILSPSSLNSFRSSNFSIQERRSRYASQPLRMQGAYRINNARETRLLFGEFARSFIRSEKVSAFPQCKSGAPLAVHSNLAARANG
jgi:hypothetical protein